MSLVLWFSPNFWNQLKHFKPHKINGKWHFIKRDIILPHTVIPTVERRGLHWLYNPPKSGRLLSYFLNTGISKRFLASIFDHAAYRLSFRGVGWNDFSGDIRRTIRYPVQTKHKDPYYSFLQQARISRMRMWRCYGYAVPEKHGVGDGLGFVPFRLNYPQKLVRQIDDDWTDTAVERYTLGLIPHISYRKYFNELPRLTAFSYGVDYTKEQLYNHISWGIDPGREKLDAILNPTDPDAKAWLEKEKELFRYYYPSIAASKEDDYTLRWPYPDDNVYRPTYERGFNRLYWGRK
mmetsp:Transcript_25997/g.46000  ORF Transcript_25997/g.46000 Transcript_25997/m.46000 type:complete len:292 (-) Transcript_25997:52-927(-)